MGVDQGIRQITRRQRLSLASAGPQGLVELGYPLAGTVARRYARSYHGDVQNNVRGVVNRSIGHFDGNPANLIPLSPADSAPLYVEMMGVASFDQLAQEGRARFDGDRTVITKLRDLMATFKPDFEIRPDTAPTQRQVPPGRPFVMPGVSTPINAE